MQVKEVDKGQECGLGLDVKFEILPVRSSSPATLHSSHTLHDTLYTLHVTLYTLHVTRHTSLVTRHTSHVVRNAPFIQNDIMEAVTRGSRAHTIEEVWGDGR